MATKLSAKLISELKSLGITAVTAEAAKEKVIASLVKEGIEGEVIEDEPLESLIQMLGEFITKEEPSQEVEEDEEEIEEEEEEELDELANEVEEEEEEEEQPKPAAKKQINTPTVKKLSTTVAKPVKKVNETPRGNSSSFEKFDPRNNKKHLPLLKPFKDIFSEKEYQFDLLKNGFTVRLLTKNAKTTIINYDELKIVDGELFGNFYSNRFKTVEDLLKVIGEDYEEREIGMFRGESHPCIRKISQEEVLAILNDTDFIEVSQKRATGIDKRMSDNREKLEAKLTTTEAKKTAPVVEQKKTVVLKKPVILKKSSLKK